MSEPTLQRVRDAFDLLAEVEHGQREALLERACAGDDELRAEVLSLLRAHDHARARFTWGDAAPGGERAADPLVGALIGGYRLRELIARGGMGAVYRAEQERPRRPVAVKVIDRHFVSAAALRRFEAEAEALGRLLHPGIARVYEAGSADDGSGRRLPFLAMELVDGLPIERWADARGVDTRARVELLSRVCDAVQHAHQKGVIHRDLKPANILVDPGGQPKVLDFGVARLVDRDLQRETMLTRTGQIVGTLPYMSPEQVRGAKGDLDTRADVYALGVLGYELLSGRLPYEVHERSLAEAAHVIEHQPPAPLVARDGRRLPRDLDTIVVKALDKDKERRYSSAAELAADLRRFMGDQPILARPASVAYQARRFARRNRALVAGALLAVIALVAGSIAAGVGLLQAERARAEAQRSSDEAEAVSEFLQNMLRASDPLRAGRDLRVVEALDEAARGLERGFSGGPRVEAAVRAALGESYRALGQLPQAELQARRALELRRGPVSGDVEKLLDAMLSLAYVRNDQGRHDEAETLLREALSVSQRALGEDHAQTLACTNNLASTLNARGQAGQAEVLYRACLARATRVLGPAHVDTLTFASNLVGLLLDRGRLDEAEPLLRDTFERSRRARGEEHPRSLLLLNTQARLARMKGDEQTAEALLRRSLALRRRVFGEAHPQTITALNNLATQLERTGAFDEAERLFEQTLALATRVLPADDWHLAHMRSNQAQLLGRLGRRREAEALLLASLAVIETALGPDHPRTHETERRLAELYTAWHRPDEAARWRARLAAAPSPAGDVARAAATSR